MGYFLIGDPLRGFNQKRMKRIQRKANFWLNKAIFVYSIVAIMLFTPGIAYTKTWDMLAFLVPYMGADTEQAPAFPETKERVARKKIKVLATAYSSTSDQTDSTPCITANGFDLCKYYGQHAVETTVASNFLPMNTSVRVKDVFGDRVLVVRDRMNERYGYGRIDIWMPTRAQAKEFGVKWIEMEIF